MRLLILSDLHREIYPNRNLKIDLEVSKPDVVILAGDIDKGPRSIQWASDLFAGLPVLYIAGNHEFYGSNIDTVPDAIQEACHFSDNVYFLNQGEFVKGGTRFLGATMWTDFKLYGEDAVGRAMMAAKTGLNDYHAIRVARRGYRKLKPLDTLELHFKHSQWLSEKLDEPFPGKTIVISHMAPSIQSVPDRYKWDPLTPCFASNLEDLAMRADLWVHGHTHTSMDYQLDKCRVVCNPCGYVMRTGNNENENFNPNFIVEI